MTKMQVRTVSVLGRTSSSKGWRVGREKTYKYFIGGFINKEFDHSENYGRNLEERLVEVDQAQVPEHRDKRLT